MEHDRFWTSWYFWVCENRNILRDPMEDYQDSLGWKRKILHDPTFPEYWELWYFGILRSCKLLSMNSSGDAAQLVSAHIQHFPKHAEKCRKSHFKVSTT